MDVSALGSTPKVGDVRVANVFSSLQYEVEGYFPLMRTYFSINIVSIVLVYYCNSGGF